MPDPNLHPVMQTALAPFMPAKPRDGAIRVNDTEYDGDTVIEMFGFWQGGEGWAVPAWEEMGRADFAGPFANRAAAERAIREAF